MRLEEQMPSRVIEPLPDQPFKTVTLRLPEDVHAELMRLAKEERRMLHSQLLVLLEQALQAVEEREAGDPRWR